MHSCGGDFRQSLFNSTMTDRPLRRLLELAVGLCGGRLGLLLRATKEANRAGCLS